MDSGKDKTQPEGPRQPPDHEAQSTPKRTEASWPSCLQTDRWTRSYTQTADIRRHKLEEGTDMDIQIPEAQTDRQMEGRQGGRQISREGRKAGRGQSARWGGGGGTWAEVPGTLSGYEVV